MDGDGVDPDAFADACQQETPKALYLDPTLHNPTTLTVPAARRAAITNVAREFGVPIVEDDAYGFIPDHGEPPFAAIAPDLTKHVAGLAKCIGARLRTAYVVAPSAQSAWPFAAMAAANVMASPVTRAGSRTARPMRSWPSSAPRRGPGKGWRRRSWQRDRSAPIL